MAKQIQLTRGMFALVDNEDYDYLMQWKWFVIKSDKKTYAARAKWVDQKTKIVTMPHDILHVPNSTIIDHRDGDGLNNTRGNIRVCSITENNRNRAVTGNKSGKFKGVSKAFGRTKYRAAITLDKKTIHLGCYATPEDAARAYDAAARSMFGEFAKTNF